MRNLFSLILAAAFSLPSASNLSAGYLEEVGYTSLVDQLQVSGSAIPNGTGVKVTQVEAQVTGTNVPYGYMPDSSQFSGASITNMSGTAFSATTSWHATMVGNAIYGNSAMGSAIGTINVYFASHWLGNGYLNFVTAGPSFTAPLVETSDIVNHSWVGSYIDSYGVTNGTTYDRIVLSRYDYAIERDDFVSVVGVNNDETGTASSKNLLASAYNVISVGVTDGTHVSGTSTTVNTGVAFPHIVAPAATTSEATGIVSSAAALLIQTGSNMGSANAMKSETIKAVLLAGATKTEFDDWDRSDTAPLDETFGAGELNIQNSFNVLAAGEQTPSVNSSALVAAAGWDYHNVSFNQTVSYYFDLTSSGDVSVALTWNAIYTGANFSSLSLSLANLNLFLYKVDAGNVLTLVQQSIATGSNLEYIWAVDLAAGNYVMQVFSASGSASYALAWQSTLDAVPLPEPGTNVLIVLGGLALSAAARKSRRREKPRSRAT